MSRVLLVDDHPLFRQALQAVIGQTQPEFTVDEAETLTGARAVLQRAHDVLLVLLDLKLSDCDGFSGLLSLKGEFPHIPVAVVSSSSDANTISRAMGLGAAGYIPKSATRVDISAAIGAILSGDNWFPQNTPDGGIPTIVEAIASLTPAQLRVLLGLQRGLRNRQIAKEMGITEKSVKNYVTMMLRKLNVDSRTQAVLAIRDIFIGTDMVQ